MAITVKHSKVSLIPDDADTSIVRPSDWNADHTLTGTIPVDNGGTGASTLTGYVKGNGTATMTASATVPSTDITGLGTMSTQNANAVAVTGGTINGATIGATTATTGAFTTATASTSVTTPTIQATSSAGLSLKNTSGTTQMLMGAGGGDNLAINVSTNINGTNAQVDLSPTGTGHVHIKPTGVNSVEINPTSVGTMDNMTIGATTPKNGSFVDLSVTGAVSFDALQGTAGQVLTSAGTGVTPTWTTPTTGTVTSVAATAGTGISVSGSPITSSGTLTITNTAPDQTVAISSGTGISVSGTYPNFTVTNTAPSSGGTVTSVSGTAPVVSSGGATPAISMAAANTTTNGYLTSTDWNTFNGKSNTNGTVTSVAALTLGTTGTDLSSTVANGTTTPVITLNVPTASATNRGALSAADWSTFNSKGNGTVTSVTGTAPIASSGGATPAISISQANTSTNGYLSSTDWNTFNGKGSGTVTSVGGTGTVNGLTLSGTVTSSGNLTLSGSVTGVANTAKAWAQALGGTGSPLTINGSFNVSSITRTALGRYVVNFTSALANINYAVSASSSSTQSQGIFCCPFYSAVGTISAPTTSSFAMVFIGTNGAAFDVDYVNFSVFN
jgi:hypothetical protein